MVPIGVSGKLTKIAPAGNYTIVNDIATIEADGKTVEVQMLQKWPVRSPRPVTKRLFATIPLITGQRVIDTFFQ
jgi:V/A-type H+-transporting ATPase subunit A